MAGKKGDQGGFLDTLGVGDSTPSRTPRWSEVEVTRDPEDTSAGGQLEAARRCPADCSSQGVPVRETKVEAAEKEPTERGWFCFSVYGGNNPCVYRLWKGLCREEE